MSPQHYSHHVLRLTKTQPGATPGTLAHRHLGRTSIAMKPQQRLPFLLNLIESIGSLVLSPFMWFIKLNQRRTENTLRNRSIKKPTGLSSVPHSLRHQSVAAFRPRALDLRSSRNASNLRYAPPPNPFQSSTKPHIKDLHLADAKTRPPKIPAARRPHNNFLRLVQTVLNHLKSSRHARLAFGSVLLLILIIGFSVAYQLLGQNYRKTYARAQTAQEHLVQAKTALQNQRFDEAQIEFLLAQEQFAQVRTSIQNQSLIQAIPVLGNKVNTAAAVLEAGELLSQAGYELTTSLKPVTDVLKGKDSTQINDQTSVADYSQLAVTTLSLARPQIEISLNRILAAKDILYNASLEDLGDDMGRQLVASRALIDDVVIGLTKINDLAEFLPDLLGANGARDYMILFQNTAEKRPTGGFIGSYGILTFEDGKLANFFADNVYNPDGQLDIKGIFIEPPKPISRMLSQNWGMRDANWSPDYPTSARKIADIYAQGSGRNLNGMIAITPDLLEQIMQVVGPIYLTKWNEIVTADNIISLVQYKVAVEFKDTEDPKLFLIDLSQIIFDRLLKLTPENWPQVAKIFGTALEQKTVFVESFNPEIAAWLTSNDLNGKVKQTSVDYLMINTANIGGTKSNQFVDESYALDTRLLADGQVENTVTITYNHRGNWEWPSDVLIAYQRIYTPLGSTLLESTNNRDGGGKLGITQTSEELGKTVFADYVQIFPGGTVSLSYTYRLPFSFSLESAFDYPLLVQKQLGTLAIPFKQRILFDPFYLEPLTTRGEWNKDERGILSIDEILRTDLQTQVTFTPHEVI